MTEPAAGRRGWSAPALRHNHERAFVDPAGDERSYATAVADRRTAVL